MATRSGLSIINYSTCIDLLQIITVEYMCNCVSHVYVCACVRTQLMRVVGVASSKVPVSKISFKELQSRNTCSPLGRVID